MKRTCKYRTTASFFAFNNGPAVTADIQKGMKNSIVVAGAEDGFTQVIAGKKTPLLGQVSSHAQNLSMIQKKLPPFIRCNSLIGVGADRVSHLATRIHIGSIVQVA
jgi:hypothetical protein